MLKCLHLAIGMNHLTSYSSTTIYVKRSLDQTRRDCVLIDKNYVLIRDSHEHGFGATDS